MARSKNRGSQEINSGSMADIAFLLLIFFLVTTTIANDKGILMILPPKPPEDQQIDIKLKQKNIFKILANSKDKLLVEDEPFGDISDVPKLRPMIKEFVLNFGKPDEEAVRVYNTLPGQLKSMSKKSPESSDNPKDAVVSFKADRGTSYELFIAIVDELQAAYNEIYGERVADQLLPLFPDKSREDLADIFRDLDKSDPRLEELYDKARDGLPRNISIAEPD
jgi:biopolymer transport protein ExbD